MRYDGMDETRRLAYLDALGIDVWRPLQSASDQAETAPTIDVIVPSTKRDDAPPAASVAASDETSAANAAPDAARQWALLRHDVTRCTQCRLHETRTHAVFGTGSRYANLLIVGEAPGAEEDRLGEPFVGRAGQLLTRMLAAIGLARDSVFIANVLKCRPPQNRDPRNDEMHACRGYLEQQIAQINPAVVLAVGRFAARQLLGEDKPLGKMRGEPKPLPEHGVPVVVTYHPAYLLRTPSAKQQAWQDLKRVRALLESAA